MRRFFQNRIPTTIVAATVSSTAAKMMMPSLATYVHASPSSYAVINTTTSSYGDDDSSLFSPPLQPMSLHHSSTTAHRYFFTSTAATLRGKGKGGKTKNAKEAEKQNKKSKNNKNRSTKKEEKENRKIKKPSMTTSSENTTNSSSVDETSIAEQELDQFVKKLKQQCPYNIRQELALLETDEFGTTIICIDDQYISLRLQLSFPDGLKELTNRKSSTTKTKRRKKNIQKGKQDLTMKQKREDFGFQWTEKRFSAVGFFLDNAFRKKKDSKEEQEGDEGGAERRKSFLSTEFTTPNPKIKKEQQKENKEEADEAIRKLQREQQIAERMIQLLKSVGVELPEEIATAAASNRLQFQMLDVNPMTDSLGERVDDNDEEGNEDEDSDPEEAMQRREKLVHLPATLKFPSVPFIFEGWTVKEIKMALVLHYNRVNYRSK